jgi:outer membrane protein insertion porin family
MFTGRGWTERRLDRGLALWENWAELRMPLVPGVLALDMFFDAAIVQQTPQQFFSDFDWEAMCFSFGAGLRFAIPQFPFRLFLVKRFRLEGGNVVWEKGIIGDDQIWSVDPVFTFVISTY